MKNNKNHQSPRLLGNFVIRLLQAFIVWGMVMLFSTQALLGQRLNPDTAYTVGNIRYCFKLTRYTKPTPNENTANTRFDILDKIEFLSPDRSRIISTFDVAKHRQAFVKRLAYPEDMECYFTHALNLKNVTEKDAHWLMGNQMDLSDPFITPKYAEFEEFQNRYQVNQVLPPQGLERQMAAVSFNWKVMNHQHIPVGMMGELYVIDSTGKVLIHLDYVPGGVIEPEIDKNMEWVAFYTFGANEDGIQQESEAFFYSTKGLGAYKHSKNKRIVGPYYGYGSIEEKKGSTIHCGDTFFDLKSKLYYEGSIGKVWNKITSIKEDFIISDGKKIMVSPKSVSKLEKL